MGGFDSPNRVFDDLAKLVAFLSSNCGAQVLNFHQALANEDNLGHFRDAGDPGVANELGVKNEEPIRLLWVAAGGGLPFEQAGGTVQPSDPVNIRYEIILVCKRPRKLDLQILSRSTDADSVVLTEPV